MNYQPIGIIHTPFKQVEDMPIQPKGATGVKGIIQIDPQYQAGLKDLDGFSHIILLYHFHLVEGYSLTVTPFLDKQSRGIFATRAPKRPNPIGFSVVRLLEIADDRLYIENVDIMDGTPLLDIKPYMPDFDHWEVDKIGWLEKSSGAVGDRRSDDRFK